MKTGTHPGLPGFLYSAETLSIAHLWTFTLITGTILRWTDWGTSLVVDGVSYSAAGPVLKRGTFRTSVGLEVDTLDLTAFHDETVLLLGLPFPQACMNGALDGAVVVCAACFMPTPGNAIWGSLDLFEGRVAEVTPGSKSTRIKVKADTDLLNTKMPRMLYEPRCSHQIYDNGCGVSRAAFQQNGTCSGGSGLTLSVSGISYPSADYWDGGEITFVSGANAGARRTVKTAAGGTVEINRPMTGSYAGSFQIVPGCAHDRSTCNNKFGNLARFRGFPFIPRPENAR